MPSPYVVNETKNSNQSNRRYLAPNKHFLAEPHTLKPLLRANELIDNGSLENAL